MDSEVVQIANQPSGSGPICRRILGELPRWFGLPKRSRTTQLSLIDRPPCRLAWPRRCRDRGVAASHSVCGLDLRHGCPTRVSTMLFHAEHSLANDGVEFLQVKTLSASKWTRATSKREASTSPMGSDRLRSFQTSGDQRESRLANGQACHVGCGCLSGQTGGRGQWLRWVDAISDFVVYRWI